MRNQRNIRHTLPFLLLVGGLTFSLLLTGCGTLLPGTMTGEGGSSTEAFPANGATVAPGADTQAETASTSEDVQNPSLSPPASEDATAMQASDDGKTGTQEVPDKNEPTENPSTPGKSDDTPSPSASPAQTATASGTNATTAPLPDAPAPSVEETGTGQPLPTDSGILVKSENELSSEEKQQLLAELEKELDALFAEINDVSSEEEMEAQN